MSRQPDRLVATKTTPLNVTTWQGSTDPVLVVHGVSSTNRLWLWLHDALPDVTLVAPDLAGRGDSPARPNGPSSVRAHADQLAELLDTLAIPAVHLLGMSLGGFVVTELAANHPDRTRSVTLVDGGFPLNSPLKSVPHDLAAEQVKSIYQSTQTWPDIEAYARHYCGSSAPLADPADPRIREMLAHEVTETPDGVRIRRDLDSLVDDALSVFQSDGPAAAFAGVKAPIQAVYAQWSVGADSPPMYPVEQVEALVAEATVPLAAELVPGVDHAGIVMTDKGAAACAKALRSSMDSA